MAKIAVLDPLVAERIAAGEVVERPFSVVKELVENSLDAGAAEIQVRLEDGGKKLIEITDNGSGMEQADLELCTLRHATSKIREVSDLEKLMSLGFRGEALPSIAACAKLEILTRAEGPASVWRDGKIESAPSALFIDQPHGTRVRVSELFAQIPARLKFLKSASAEVTQVREHLERLAIARPEVGFRLISEDRTLLALRPESRESRLRKVLAEDQDYPIRTHERAYPGGLTVQVLWVHGLSQPSTRKLMQVVNGRVLKDRMLQQAILQPLKQAFLPGQFPAIALYMQHSPAEMDVNVHPTKSEVRFLRPQEVFRAIEETVSDLVHAVGVAGYAPGDSAFDLSTTASPEWTQASTQTASPRWSAHQSAPILPGLDTPTVAAALESTTSTSPFARHQYVGSLFQTYLLYDHGQELVLVDQHAAHERVRYEGLKKQALAQGVVPRQELLLPEAVPYPLELKARLDARVGALERMGFGVEDFGPGKLLIRSIPAAWGAVQLPTRLKGLVDRLLESEEELPPGALDESLFEKLASEACHSAIRAGDRLHDEAAHALVEQLFQCEHPWNCPHGRPTISRVPRARFEEWFQRRVPG